MEGRFPKGRKFRLSNPPVLEFWKASSVPLRSDLPSWPSLRGLIGFICAYGGHCRNSNCCMHTAVHCTVTSGTRAASTGSSHFADFPSLTFTLGSTNIVVICGSGEVPWYPRTGKKFKIQCAAQLGIIILLLCILILLVFLVTVLLRVHSWEQDKRTTSKFHQTSEKMQHSKAVGFANNEQQKTLPSSTSR
jgi:hypothetical protein